MNRPPPDLHAELEERLRFEMLLTELSARFVNVTAESIDDEIVSAQGQIVQAFDLDRSVLGQIQEGGNGFVYTHSWFRPGVETSSGASTSHLPWIARKLAPGQAICFARIDDLPEEPIEEREFAHRFGLLSLAIACGPGGDDTSPQATRALFTYNLLAGLYLGFLRVGGAFAGYLLWPACILHVLLALLLARPAGIPKKIAR